MWFCSLDGVDATLYRLLALRNVGAGSKRFLRGPKIERGTFVTGSLASDECELVDASVRSAPARESSDTHCSLVVVLQSTEDWPGGPVCECVLAIDEGESALTAGK